MSKQMPYFINTIFCNYNENTFGSALVLFDTTLHFIFEKKELQERIEILSEILVRIIRCTATGVLHVPTATGVLGMIQDSVMIQDLIVIQNLKNHVRFVSLTTILLAIAILKLQLANSLHH